jgi:hypothetical protein
MRGRFYRTFVIPLLISFFSVTPWYLFSKFVLKLEINLEAFAVLIVVLSSVPLVLLNRWKEKVPDAKEQERRIIKVFTTYGKGLALIVSVQCLMIILLILLILI